MEKVPGTYAGRFQSVEWFEDPIPGVDEVPAPVPVIKFEGMALVIHGDDIAPLKKGLHKLRS